MIIELQQQQEADMERSTAVIANKETMTQRQFVSKRAGLFGSLFGFKAVSRRESSGKYERRGTH